MTRNYSLQLQTLNRPSMQKNSGILYPFEKEENEKKKNIEDINRN